MNGTKEFVLQEDVFNGLLINLTVILINEVERFDQIRCINN